MVVTTTTLPPHQLSPLLSHNEREKKTVGVQKQEKNLPTPAIGQHRWVIFPDSVSRLFPLDQSPQPFDVQFCQGGLRSKSRDLGEWELGGLRQNGERGARGMDGKG